jgi:hypothetical protein
MLCIDHPGEIMNGNKIATNSLYHSKRLLQENNHTITLLASWRFSERFSKERLRPGHLIIYLLVARKGMNYGICS